MVGREDVPAAALGQVLALGRDLDIAIITRITANDLLEDMLAGDLSYFKFAGQLRRYGVHAISL